MDKSEWLIIGANGGIGKPLLTLLSQKENVVGLSSKGGLRNLFANMNAWICAAQGRQAAVVYLVYTRNPIYNLAFIFTTLVMARKMKECSFFYFSTFSFSPNRRGVFRTSTFPRFSSSFSLYNINKFINELWYCFLARFRFARNLKLYTVCPTFVTGEGTKFASEIRRLADFTAIVAPKADRCIPVQTVSDLKDALALAREKNRETIFEKKVTFKEIFSNEHCGKEVTCPILIESVASLDQQAITPVRGLDWPFFIFTKIPILGGFVRQRLRHANVGSFRADLFLYSEPTTSGRYE